MKSSNLLVPVPCQLIFRPGGQEKEGASGSKIKRRTSYISGKKRRMTQFATGITALRGPQAGTTNVKLVCLKLNLQVVLAVWVVQCNEPFEKGKEPDWSCKK